MAPLADSKTYHSILHHAIDETLTPIAYKIISYDQKGNPIGEIYSTSHLLLEIYRERTLTMTCYIYSCFVLPADVKPENFIDYPENSRRVKEVCHAANKKAKCN